MIEIINELLQWLLILLLFSSTGTVWRAVHHIRVTLWPGRKWSLFGRDQ